MSREAGSIRDEAERLVLAVLARVAGGDADFTAAAYDAERVQRLARAVGDTAVAVSGLLQELSRWHDSSRPIAASLRSAFLGLASGFLDAVGVDPRTVPPPAGKGDTDAPDAASSRRSTEPEDPWRAATRDDWRAAQRPAGEKEW